MSVSTEKCRFVHKPKQRTSTLRRLPRGLDATFSPWLLLAALLGAVCAAMVLAMAR